MSDRRFVVLSPQGAARSVGEQFISSLAKLVGNSNVKVFDCRKYIQAYEQLLRNQDPNMVADLLNQSLIVGALEFQATHVLVLALSPVTLFTLRLLKKQGIKTVHWFYEDYRIVGYWKNVMEGYDHFFAIQYGPLQEQAKVCGTKFHFLPPAASFCDPGSSDSYNTGGEERNTDVVFVGVPSTYRVSLLESLVAAGHSVIIAGAGWDRYRGPLDPCILHRQWIEPEQSCKLYRRGKIGLNMSVIQPGAERQDVHVSPRVYDLFAAGLAVIAEDVPLCRESLDGFSYDTFRNSEELPGVVASVLKEYSSRIAQRTKNKEIVSAIHTYEKRAEQIVELTKDE